MTVIRRSASFILAALLLTVATRAGATPIISGTPLAGADVTVVFAEHIFPTGTEITNQFADLGVTFESLLYYDTLHPSEFPGIIGHRLGNFVGSGQGLQDPFSIHFTSPVEAATFGLATNIAQTRLTALFQNVAIESFQYFSGASNPATAFVGFQGLLFDEILVEVAVFDIANSVALIDNVQYRVSEVPEPGSVLLLGSGVAGLWILRRRRA